MNDIRWKQRFNNYQKAFQTIVDIEDGEAWMKMIEDRNKTSHTYNINVAEEVVDDIIERFFPAFDKLSRMLGRLYEQGDDNA